MRHYYLAEYESDFDVDTQEYIWRPPFFYNGTYLDQIDFRSVSEMSQTLSTQNYSLFVYSDTLPNDTKYVYFGNDLDRVMSAVELANWKALGQFSSSPTTKTLRDVIWESVTTLADPTGYNSEPPTEIGPNNRASLVIKGETIKSFIVGKGSAEWDVFSKVLQENYRKIRDDVLAGREVANKHLQYLGGNVQRYGGIPISMLRPDDLPDEGYLPPETTITESFDVADQEDLGPDLSWTEFHSSGDYDIVSNKARQTSSSSVERYARADTSLSSDDHYAEAEITWFVAEGAHGVFCRKAAGDTAVTLYRLRQQYGASTGAVELDKKVANATTSLDSSTESRSSGNVLKVEADDSGVKGYLNDTEVVSSSNTDITGNLRTGIYSHKRGDLNDFEAADLGGGGGLSIPVAQHHRQQQMVR